MLIEMIQNKPLQKPFSINDIPTITRAEMQQIVSEKCNVNLLKPRLVLNDKKIENVITTYKQVYDKISSLNFSPANVKPMILNEIMSDLFNVWFRSDDRLKFFSHMKNNFTAAQLTHSIATYMDDSNMDDLLDFFFENMDKIFSVKRKIKTIALYYYSMFNNGIARFITLIIPIFLDMGYKIVLITDDIDEERDYPLPQNENLKRVVIQTPYDNFLGRLEELEGYVNEYEIDLFCSHAYYGKFPPIYQILLFKMLDVPVIVEMHSVFTVIVPYNKKLDKVYRLADGIVTLSRIEKMFWANHGCNCYMIFNPIETAMIQNRPIRNPRKNRKTILWIGKIANNKQPSEIIPIMKEVVQYIPDAKINVLADADDKTLFKNIQDSVIANSLEKNVILCGFHKEVQPFFEEADLMLMTSVVEGFSYVVAEGKLNALPLVCYELPYLEFFRRGKGYISVRQYDRHGAAMAIVKILTDDDLRSQMSVEARESIQQFIDYDVSGAWKKVFDDIETGTRHDEKNFEMEQIELLMMQGLANQNMQIRYLNNLLNNH
ncbi:MAG: glycosyltransferase family 4 protein [Selenomonadaceae bacterium]|nr:glycosyltransferase family 4 protein [Selenomonadaceae bacterium]